MPSGSDPRPPGPRIEAAVDGPAVRHDVAVLGPLPPGAVPTAVTGTWQ